MKQRNDNTQKCEFILTLGKNIVCQRFFSVRNFNNIAANSLDLHYSMTNIVYEIEDKLKQKTLFLMDSHFRENTNPPIPGEDNFMITIKKGNTVIYSRILPADIYPPKVRYTVDVLSSRKVTTYYQDYSLIVRE